MIKKKRKPRKPHPDCTWDEKYGIWLWPDDRSPARQKADEEIARTCETRDLRRYGPKLSGVVTLDEIHGMAKVSRRRPIKTTRPRARRKTA